MKIILIWVIVFTPVIFWIRYVNRKQRRPSSISEKQVDLVISDIDEEDDDDSDDYLTIEVTGVHISARRKLIEEYLGEYDHVKLIPEPRNPVNKKAIAIHSEFGKIGYVGDSDLDTVWPLMDMITFVEVSRIFNDFDRYIEVEVNIYYKA